MKIEAGLPEITIELPVPGSMGDVGANLSKLILWANELGLKGQRVVTVNLMVRPYTRITDIQCDCLESLQHRDSRGALDKGDTQNADTTNLNHQAGK